MKRNNLRNWFVPSVAGSIISLKRRILIGFAVVTILHFAGCGRAEEAKRLDHFKGDWKGSFFVYPGTYFIQTSANQSDPNTISLGFSFYFNPIYIPDPRDRFRTLPSVHEDRFTNDSPQNCRFSLRYDSQQRKYFLDAQIGPKLSIVSLPLTYSVADGYVGNGTSTVDGQLTTVAVKIYATESGSVWTISFDAAASASAARPGWKEQFVLSLNKASE